MKGKFNDIRHATGLKLKAYQPKETIYHVAEIVKNQIREKEDVQKKDRRVKSSYEYVIDNVIAEKGRA